MVVEGVVAFVLKVDTELVLDVLVEYRVEDNLVCRGSVVERLLRVVKKTGLGLVLVVEKVTDVGGTVVV